MSARGGVVPREASLNLVVRVPHAVVLNESVLSVRVPTDTGQVGLRPGAEAAVLVVEPGLVLLRRAEGERIVATAGGVLRFQANTATLSTPLAVAGDDAAALRGELEEALRLPTAELELRTVLQRLEAGLLSELRRSPTEPDGGLPRGRS